MNTEKTIIDHYTNRDMADQILAAARKNAVDPACLTVDELAPYDEFHIGRRQATLHFLKLLKLSPGMNVLDIGCGIGGAARVAAVEYDVTVTGLDLTPQFVDTAQILSDAAGLSAKTKFQIGSATEMPFAAESFDAAFTIHAAMNIADKAALYSHTHRVLKPGAVFGIYDILAGAGEGALEFPVPWSPGPETSLLASLEEMRTLLAGAGFEIIHDEDRRAFALEVIRPVETGETPSPHRPDDFPLKSANLRRNLEAGRCATHIFICRCT